MSNSLFTASSSSSVASSLYERWERRDLETGWQDLHIKIMNYRQNNQITIVHFIKLCELPNQSYFRQLCCMNGNEIHPSNKAGSAGKRFLDAVAVFFQRVENGFLPPLILERDLENELYDFLMDHIEELHLIGIHGLKFNKHENKIIVKVLSSAVREDVKKFLNEKFHLEGTDFEFLDYELLYSPPPYTVTKKVKDEILMGTVTPLNLTGSVVMVTCAHYVGQVHSEVHSYSFKDDDVPDDPIKIGT